MKRLWCASLLGLMICLIGECWATDEAQLNVILGPYQVRAVPPNIIPYQYFELIATNAFVTQYQCRHTPDNSGFVDAADMKKKIQEAVHGLYYLTDAEMASLVPGTIQHWAFLNVDDNGLIGFLLAGDSRYYEEAAYFAGGFVVPACQRRGFAQLVFKGIAPLLFPGKASYHVLTRSFNAPAIQAYKKYGFSESPGIVKIYGHDPRYYVGFTKRCSFKGPGVDPDSKLGSG